MEAFLPNQEGQTPHVAYSATPGMGASGMKIMSYQGAPVTFHCLSRGRDQMPR